MQAIKLTVDQWKRIRTELQTEHPKTVFMLRDKMKKVLGFTVREHKAWIDKPAVDGDDLNFGYSEYQIHLDFYSTNKRTMFLLKFSDIIGNINEKR
jgi:hypothetical protein